MLDDNGVLSGLLRAMRQQATANFCQLLRDIADDLESEPLEEYQAETEPEGFAEIWADR